MVEQIDIDGFEDVEAWHKTVKESQPPEGTLGLLLYVRGGRVCIKRDMLNEFPTLDIPKAKKLICEYLDMVFERDSLPQV